MGAREGHDGLRARRANKEGKVCPENRRNRLGSASRASRQRVRAIHGGRRAELDRRRAEAHSPACLASLHRPSRGSGSGAGSQKERKGSPGWRERARESERASKPASASEREREREREKRARARLLFPRTGSLLPACLPAAAAAAAASSSSRCCVRLPACLASSVLPVPPLAPALAFISRVAFRLSLGFPLFFSTLSISDLFSISASPLRFCSSFAWAGRTAALPALVPLRSSSIASGPRAPSVCSQISRRSASVQEQKLPVLVRSRLGSPVSSFRK
ncbi:hypothetical protein MARPO_0019s0072 [Marchantia polymorpha]|uniref:Uncharacterized protein n=1 Tax=Marchantia polymorpha TaxID=3197 RepID=A0A2R6XEW3_MARPO|nr:hypothetical protein MARPO_0019s0072 [Marchantia polymorpha]|eukprot:PTQ44648.1 hypothetical protein MARPO_0019s0072 [Marchantia polymorpha]